jgi:TRAP-type C4-dicarboxylate transport system permease small subunit
MKAIRFLTRIMNMAASGMLGAMMLLTVADVCLRYFLRKPILGATEITENLMVCLTFFAVAWCAAQGSHLKVDLVMGRLSPRVQAFFDGLTTLAGLCLVILIAWRSFAEAGAMRELNIVSSLLKIPAYPFYYVVALGSAMLCLIMVVQLIENVGKAVKG